MRSGFLTNAVALTLVALATGCPSPSSTSCTQDSQCAAGLYCVGAQCEACPSCGEGETCIRAQCLPTSCGDRPCHTGQGCVQGVCVGSDCVAVTCPAGQTCAQGSCYPTDCPGGVTCLAGEVCWQQACRSSLCQGVQCEAGETCGDGQCLSTECAGIVCAIGAACEDGHCQDVRCIGVVCSAGTICADGRCVPQGCQGVICAAGSGCVDGQCVDVQCVGVACPAGLQCVSGGCVGASTDAGAALDAAALEVDAAVPGLDAAAAEQDAATAGQDAATAGQDASVPISGTASVSAATYSGNYAFATYQFTGTASGGAGALTTTWTGPAPLPDSSLSPTVTFACSALVGGQTVTLTITDADGKSAQRTVNLAACPAPVAGTAAASAPIYNGSYTSATYKFIGTASGGSGALVTSWTGPPPLPNLSLSPTVTFACTDLVGGKTVTLTISDANAQSAIRTVGLVACPDPNQPAVFVSGGIGALPSLVEDPTGTYLYATGANGVSKITIATGAVSQIATIAQICPADVRVDGITLASDGFLYTICYDVNASPITRMSTSGAVTPFTTVGPFIQDITADASGSLYYTDFSGGRVVYKMVIATKSQSIFAGTYMQSGCADGSTGIGMTNSPYGMVWNGGTLYFGDWWNYTIRKTTGTTNLTTLAGACGVSAEVDGATGAVARFTRTSGLTSDGTFVYVAEQGGYIRRVRISDGQTVTIAKTGLALNDGDLAIGPNGILYIGNSTDDDIYQLPNAATLGVAP